MKVLTVLSYYYPHWTGLTAHAVRVAEGLARRGHHVTVLTARHAPELAGRETINGVEVIRLPVVGRFSRGMVAPTFLPRAARLIAQNDVVQIHTPLPEALAVAWLCRALDKPLLMTHHGDLVMPPGAANRVMERIGFELLRNTAALADGVTSYSQDYAEHSKLLRPFMQKVHAIYPPVDIVDPDPERVARWRADLGLQDKEIIGFAGRWVDEKGFDYLLRAMDRVRAEVPEAHLAFAGERHVAYEDTYERCRPLIAALRDHITFLGLLTEQSQMADFYGMCSVFALPSRTDMFALVQVEAMLCGTPVVASDIPGARVVVQETGFGRLARPRDPVSLAEALVDVVRHRQRYAPTREGVRRVFDTRHTMEQYEQALQGAIRCRHGQAGRIMVVPASPRAGQPVGQVFRRGPGQWASLDAQDHAIVDRVLGNEADMAYRRRVRILLDYLELEHGDRVLDLGCGMGFYLTAMSKLRDLELYGTDRSRIRLSQAARRGVPAALVQGDLLALPFADGSFDKVLMSEVLEHVSDDQASLQEVWRVLRPGGILAVSVPHADFPLLWDPINRLWTGLGGAPIRQGPLVGIWTNHQRLYRPEELATKVAAAGFSVETLEEATHYSVPFLHFLVYGVGKPLLERGLLPGPVRASADRFAAERDGCGLLDPVGLGVAVLRAADRLNDRPSVAHQTTFVNVLLKANKPA